MTSRVLPTQAETLEWVRQRWPHRTHPEARALKLGEECGEVQGAVTKWLEGRDTIDHVRQEAAQAVIVAMTLAESLGFDLTEAIADEWERCGVRTWDAVAELEGIEPSSEPVVDLMAALEKSLEKIKRTPGRPIIEEITSEEHARSIDQAGGTSTVRKGRNDGP